MLIEMFGSVVVNSFRADAKDEYLSRRTQAAGSVSIQDRADSEMRCIADNRHAVGSMPWQITAQLVATMASPLLFA